jgi:hypothetical protein
MCFSAEADIAGGIVAGVIGIDALRHVEHPSELALASLPVLFGVHQLTEAFVWWGLDGKISSPVGHAATWFYLAVAFGLLPVLAPLCIRAVEPEARRRSFMAVAAAFGAAVALVYLVAIVRSPVGARIDGHHIVYAVNVRNGGLVDGVYAFVTCLPPLFSSHRRIVAFGAVNAAAIIGLLWLGSNGSTSLWCAWAALTSVAIAAHLRDRETTEERHPVLAWPAWLHRHV